MRAFTALCSIKSFDDNLYNLHTYNNVGIVHYLWYKTIHFNPDKRCFTHNHVQRGVDLKWCLKSGFHLRRMQAH